MKVFDKFKKKTSIEIDDKAKEENGLGNTFVPDGVSSFKINGIEFGFDKVIFELSEIGQLKNLEILGSEEIFAQVKAVENRYEIGYSWDWVLYPPNVYFREVNLPIDDPVVINEELLDDYDVALYLMEHIDFYGTLTITNDYIELKAKIEEGLIENPRTLEILIDRKSL